jgi:choline dehydrogenase-like flavoprotein
MERTTTEVLVIGSGFGGAAPALRMAQAGFQVTMLEKGGEIRPERDFRQSQDPQYLLRYIKTVRGDNVNLTFAEGLGGGSGFYEMVTLRAPSMAFDQRVNGRRLWPAALGRAGMDPFYEIAERMMRVKQIPAREVPRTGVAFALLLKKLGWSVDRVPYSVRGCVGHAFCVAGCVSGAKVTLIETYLEPARALGMTILTDQNVRRVRPVGALEDEGRDVRNIRRLPYRYEVLSVHEKTGEALVVQAKVLILAGGTVGTAKLLLNSRQDLPLLSGELGKNIAVNGTVKSIGILPEDIPDGDMFSGRSHPGVISYQFLESRGITISTAKPLPVDAVSYANLYLEGDHRTPSWWGQARVDLMKLYRRRAIVLYALGLCTSSAELRLRGRKGDVVPSFRLDEPFRRYYRETLELLHSILRRTGGRVAHVKIIDGQGMEYPDLHTTTAHMTGSCRMAESARDGVVDPDGEVFGYPGMYIADGAAIPSSLAVNPYLTILANAERVAAHVKRRYSTGRMELSRSIPGTGPKRPAQTLETA